MAEMSSRAAALLMRHYASLYGYVFVLLGNHLDAEDALQEVAVVVAQKFGGLDHEDNFLPWARGIARIEVLSAKRRRSRLPPLADPDAIQAMSDAARDVDRATVWSERHAVLLKCLGSIPAKSQELIRLRYSDECPDIETLARRVNRTVSATYGLVKRIRQVLRECVERKLAEGNNAT
ncbi:sigma-70 family RNA polymerase sigma factor [Gemmata sp.]|uniref:sigma-70 family RNA polymerase sigma factor n=1 Tax=Gemmata sp. TaxID=1914242 RepID=UPI003F7135B4